MPKRFLRVFIAESSPSYRDGLIGFVRGQPAVELRGGAPAPEDVATALKEQKPDICLVELGGGARVDAAGLIRKLKRASGRTRFVILAKKSQASLAAKALGAGAAGFVIKDKAVGELLATLGRSAAAAATVSRPRRGAESILTRRETEVVKYLAGGRTVRQIAALLDLSPKTIDAHKTNLMRKLKIHSRLELFRYAIRHKLVKG